MHDFHYNYMKEKYDSKVKVLFTNTESLTYESHIISFFK